MARLIVSMNVSLDGYIEARSPQGEDDGSWLSIDEPVHRAFNAQAQSADAFLYGRKVYQVMIPYWPDAARGTDNPAYEREYAQLWIDKPKLVVSTSLSESRWNTRVIGADVLAEVARLKASARNYVLCYGGAQLASTLQQAGLVDEYALYVHPATLGSGAPLFRDRVDLKLVDMRRFDSGVLELRYAPRA